MRCGLQIVLAGALLLGSPVIALGDNVRTDYNHQTNFSQYHTYSWGKVTTKIPFYADRIKQEVNLQLQAKGWHLMDSGGAVTVFASDSLHNQQETQTMYDGFGGGWGGGWGWGGWGRRMGGSWARHDHHDQPADDQPRDRHLREQFEEPAMEGTRHGGSFGQLVQKREVHGQRHLEDVQGLSPEADEVNQTRPFNAPVIGFMGALVLRTRRARDAMVVAFVSSLAS